MLDLKQLSYFVIVAELESISRASVALNITQSPLSRQIQDLEDRLQLKLFDRVKQRVRLTSDGRKFLVQAKALLEASNRCEAAAAALAVGQVGPLRVGYVDAAVHAGLVTRLLHDLSVSSPALRVELRSLRSAAQLEMLDDGRIDLALTHSVPARAPELLTTYRLIEEPFVLAVPSCWRQSIRGPAAVDLADMPFIAPPLDERNTWRMNVLDACRAAGFEPDIRIEASNLATVLELVRGGVGAAIVQESVSLSGREGIRFYPLPPPFRLRLEIYASLRKTDERSQALRSWVQSARLRSH
ncbi:LysR family transcriptional regulator [Caulobacter henricii]|uniref:HTH lysR-type domain-containing protein n=1 Tax=Caulobacter henricii TaxID=69395 RepID=A0A0P0NXW7_9CAUL|nr:LysR family transcriptional regulator [Caulobacter henricii]ALL12957.1 hypothetical protein AQ619_06095 [Caulobacter henricii]